MQQAHRNVPNTKYWFEHDSRNDLWVGKVTQSGEEVCVVVGSTRGEVMSSVQRAYKKFRREAA